MNIIRDYERIAFYLWIGKEKVRKYKEGKKSHTIMGARIGEYLIVARSSPTAETYKIYVLLTHKPFINVSFINATDAIRFAEQIEKLFSEYLLLLEEYPGSDVIALAKWSVPSGIRLYETVQLLRNQKGIDMEDINRAYLEAQENVKQWTNQLRRPA